MFQIKIPKPCHADWNEMTPTKQGAFCSSCSKEVVDFTRMSDEEVKNYFLSKSTGSTCGRFKTEQIHRIRIQLPDNIFIQKIAGWKKYMAVVLLAFGSMLFGCDVDVNKPTVGETEVQAASNKKLLSDTTASIDTTQLLGEIAMPMGAPAIVEKDKNNCDIITGATAVPPVMMGDISVEPDTVVKPVIDTTTRMGEIAIPSVRDKKALSDSAKCKDPGFY